MNDHERGCQGREYTCTCGYDDKRDALIETLVKALEEAGSHIEPDALFILPTIDEALSAARKEGF